MALTANLLYFAATSGPADAVCTQLAKPVLVLSALLNAETTDLEPSTRWQAGMQGRAATIWIPVAADAPMVLCVDADLQQEESGRHV
jgi:hypothetical protein